MISGKLLDDGKIQLFDIDSAENYEIFDPKTYKAYSIDGKTEIGALKAAVPAPGVSSGTLDSIELKNGSTLDILSKNVTTPDNILLGKMQSDNRIRLENASLMDIEGRVYSSDGKTAIGTYDPEQTARFKEPLVKLDNGTYLHANDPASAVRTLGTGTEIGNMGSDGKILMDGAQGYLSPDAAGTVQDLTGKPIGTFDLAQSEKIGAPAFKLAGQSDFYVYGKTMAVKAYDGDLYSGHLEDGPSGKIYKLANGTYDALDGKGTILGKDGKTPLATLHPGGSLVAPDGTLIGNQEPDGKIKWSEEGIGKLGAAGGLVGLLAGFGLSIAADITNNPTLEAINQIMGMLDPIGGFVAIISATQDSQQWYQDKYAHMSEIVGHGEDIMAKYNYDVGSHPGSDREEADVDPLIQQLKQQYATTADPVTAQDLFWLEQFEGASNWIELDNMAGG